MNRKAPRTLAVLTIASLAALAYVLLHVRWHTPTTGTNVLWVCLGAGAWLTVLDEWPRRDPRKRTLLSTVVHGLCVALGYEIARDIRKHDERRQ